MQTAYDEHNPLLVSYDTLQGSLEAAAFLGGDLTPAIIANHIEAPLLENPRGFLTLHQLVGFLNDAADLLDCPHFGFLLGKHQPPMQFGLLGQLPRFAANLREALADAEAFGPLFSEFSRWELRAEENHARVIRHNRVAFSGSLLQLEALGITVVFKALKKLSGGQWQASQITFIHSAPPDKSIYEKYFDVPVIFNQECNSIIFQNRLLELAVSTADENLHETLKTHLLSLQSEHSINDDLVARLRYHIKQNLGTNRCNIDSIAQLFGLHPRTLQRDLAKQHTSFRHLLNNVRQEMTEHYLRSSSMTLIELADILGYRNASALSRAFKNATGLSPERWKANIAP